MTQRSTTRARAQKPSQPAPANESKPAPAPDTQNQSVSTIVRKYLLARPDFPRLYADVVISSAPNSKLAKVLRDNYQKLVGTNMPIHQNVQSCTHIKVTGVRCGAPALRGEQFCYFHQRMVRGVRTPPQARLHPIALIEDEESIQAALMEVINALMRNTIDLKRATLILRALHIAVKNAQRARLHQSSSQAITEIPDYNPPARNPEPTEFEIPQTAAPIEKEEEKTAREASDFKARWQAGEKALKEMEPEARRILNEILHPNVGTDAFVRPSGPDVSGRSPTATASIAAPRKPPQTAKAQAPKERKNAAHGASRGTG